MDKFTVSLKICPVFNLSVMSYIERTLTPVLERAHRIFPVVTLTGPRQSGKTTLARHCYPNIPYVNFENVQTGMLFNQDPVGYLNSFQEGLIIDEAQLEPSVFRALQTVVDEDRYVGIKRKFIITGSSNFSIMAKSAESMAGRTMPLTLLPLSVREILNAGIDGNSDEFMFKGGYPQIWTSETEDAEFIIQSYIDTYVEKDLRQLLNIKDLNKFIRFLGLCAGRAGTELNKYSLAVETGVSVGTVDSWLSVLEASYVIWLLPPWSTNLNKRLTKSPKLYFCDTGILCSLLGIREASQLANFPLRGAIFENMVANNFLKAFYNVGRKPAMTFYRDKTGREIDFVIETAAGLHLIEAKASTGFNPDFLRNIRYFEKTFPDKVVSSAVIYNGPDQIIPSATSLFNFRSSIPLDNL